MRNENFIEIKHNIFIPPAEVQENDAYFVKDV